MGTYITVASVRRTCGIDSSEIEDDDVEDTITEVEAQIPRYFNTVFAPTQVLEKYDGDGSNRLLLNHNPILCVRALKIDGTTEDPANLEIWKDSGYIYLGQDATSSKFKLGRNKVVVKYLHGNVELSTTSTTSAAATTAGTSVSVEVASSASFAVNDWVEINGMDGNQEVGQIEAIADSTHITVDQLVLAHESGSTVTKMELNQTFVKLLNLVASIALVARIVGQSYNESTGYSLGELQVQKGEPYTQWRETANQFIRERDEIMSRLINRPFVM